MADDPLAGYTPSAPSAPSDPLAGYTPSASTSAWNFINRPIATGSIADTARVAANTLGIGDRLLAGNKTVLPMMFPSLFGQDASSVAPGGANDPATLDQRRDAALQVERDKTAEANSRLTGAGSFIANTAGALPLSALGVAGGTAKALGVAAPITRTLVGNMVEGGLGGGLGAAGRGGNVVGGITAGALGGLVATPIGGMANWAARKIATPVGRMFGILSDQEGVVNATNAAKTAEYTGPSGASQYEFNPNDVNAAYTAAKKSLQPSQVEDLSSGMNAKFNGHIKANQAASSVDANNIDGYRRGIQGAVSSNGDSVLAARIKSNLDGVMGSATPTSGQPVGDALLQINKARTAAQQATMAEGLQKASTDLKNQYVSPGPWAQQQSKWYKPGTDQYNDLSGIVRSAGGASALPSGYGTAHAVGDIAEVGLASAGMPGAGIVAGVGTQALKPLLSGATNWLKRRQLLEQLNSVYPSLTGQSVVAQPPVGNLIRSAIEGQTAGGNYP